jgi:hypothetical protein
MRAPGNENFEFGRIGFILFLCFVLFIACLVIFKSTGRKKQIDIKATPTMDISRDTRGTTGQAQILNRRICY